MAHICPDCGIELTRRVIDAIPYEECEQCAGIWVTDIALKCLEDKGPNELAQLEEAHHPTRPVDRHAARACPVCRRPIQRFLTPGDPPVELDRCDLCEGTWIDDTELGRMAQAMQAANHPQQQPAHLDAETVLAEFSVQHESTMARSQAVTVMFKGMSHRVRFGRFMRIDFWP